MIKCPNCGANIYNYYCEYCGTRIEPPKKKGIVENIYDTIMEKVNRAAENHSNKGIPPSAMPNQYFMDNYMKEHKAFHEKSEEEKNAVRERNRLARIAVSNGKCPACGTPFQTFRGMATAVCCNKCGADINQLAYIDRF